MASPEIKCDGEQQESRPPVDGIERQRFLVADGRPFQPCNKLQRTDPCGGKPVRTLYAHEADRCRLRITPWRRSVRDEATEAAAVACGNPVQRVDERRRASRTQHSAEEAGQPNLEEQRDAASGVARNQRAVAEDQPPAFVPCLLGHRREQIAGLLTLERKQAELSIQI